MQAASMHVPFGEGLSDRTVKFYRGVLETLTRTGCPFLVGGAYAFNHYTGINRPTKDLDLFLKREDFDRLAGALQDAGYETELTYPHWLGKVHSHGVFIDLIFSSGNGIAVVDDAWFRHGEEIMLLDVRTRLCPIEETIWSKAFIMERERYDGADIAHLIFACAERMDWYRLVERFDPHWRVLLSHLILFGFVYPADRNRVPAWVLDDLLNRLRKEMQAAPEQADLCQGTLLSREQYLPDIEEQGFEDGRIAPRGNMSREDAASWTRAIQREAP